MIQINIVGNGARFINRYLQDTDKGVLINVPDVRNAPSESVFKTIRDVLAGSIDLPWSSTIDGRYVEISNERTHLNTQASSGSLEGLNFVISFNCVYETGKNVNLNDKVEQIIKQKRRQHRSKYPSHPKLYYLFVDCPIHRLQAIDPARIARRLKPYEIVVTCANEGKSTGDSEMIVCGPSLVIADRRFVSRVDLASEFTYQVRRGGNE
jgi:hypothetical protein